MANLCLSRIATSLWVSSWESLSLMMIGVSRLLLRKTYLKPEGRGFSSIVGCDGTSIGSSSIGFASSPLGQELVGPCLLEMPLRRPQQGLV